MGDAAGRPDFDLDTLKATGMHKLAGNFSAAQHCPDGAYGDYSIVVTGNDNRMAQIVIYGDVTTLAWRACGWAGEFLGKWNYAATATPPQEYDLPLAAGVTRGKRCVYSKAQDSLVVVRFSAAFPATASRTQKIGTLPAGYRSSEATVGAGKITHTSGDTTTAAAVELWENGDITVYGNTTGFTSASGILVFYAS